MTDFLKIFYADLTDSCLRFFFVIGYTSREKAVEV